MKDSETEKGNEQDEFDDFGVMDSDESTLNKNKVWTIQSNFT